MDIALGANEEADDPVGPVGTPELVFADLFIIKLSMSVAPRSAPRPKVVAASGAARAAPPTAAAVIAGAADVVFEVFAISLEAEDALGAEFEAVTRPLEEPCATADSAQ